MEINIIYINEPYPPLIQPRIIEDAPDSSSNVILYASSMYWLEFFMKI